MDQDPNVPKASPEGETSEQEEGSIHNPIDIDSILLPKKTEPGKTPQSAQRINASILLAQEQNAELPKPEHVPAEEPPPEPKKDESVVKPIETYQGDIEKIVHSQNTSVVSIAAAEAERRSTIPIEAALPAAGREIDPFFKKVFMFGGGTLLLTIAVGAIIFVVTRPGVTVPVSLDTVAPFITVDETDAFIVPPEVMRHASLITALETQREKLALSLGLLAQLYLALPATTSSKTVTPITAQQLLTLLGPQIPDSLVRSVDPYEYLLGIHSYDGNQPFLILATNAYEQTFRGMIEWEPVMKQDLSVLFARTPPQHLVGTVATSSPTSTPVIIQTGFIDRTVENHEARVIENNTRDILLLWTFLDRNTLVITTNEVTLREIIARFSHAPVVPLP